jgi:hypothetical protein
VGLHFAEFSAHFGPPMNPNGLSGERLLAMHHEAVNQQSYEKKEEIVNSLECSEADRRKQVANR